VTFARFGPLLAAATLGLVVTTAHRRLPPRLAARMTVATLAAIALAALSSLWLLGLGYLAHAPLIGDRLRWCAMVLGVHHEVSAVVGLPATMLAIVGIVRFWRVIRLHRRVVCHEPAAVEVVESPEPYAATIPGRGGRIVMSTGLFDLLDDDERDGVLLHEQAHARFRHDRYLLVARAAAALIPGAQFLGNRLHFSVERWADEVAANRLGDRRIVATTLAKVALHHHGQPVATLGFAGLGVPARVQALLQPRRPHPPRALTAALWTAIGLTTALAFVQLHHVAGLIAALCPGR
jgi:Zn-dependent protease with chaperone function